MAVMMKSAASQKSAVRSVSARQSLAVRPALLVRSSNPEKNEVDLAGVKLPLNRQAGNQSSLPPPVDNKTADELQSGLGAESGAQVADSVDVLGFWGAPELINGRLAMLGFTAALAAELATGESVATQVMERPAGIALTFVVFIIASLVPAFTRRKPDIIGPFTPLAEIVNGRAAMIGFVALLFWETVRHRALF